MKNTIFLSKKIMLLMGFAFIHISYTELKINTSKNAPQFTKEDLQKNPNIYWNFEIYNKSDKNIVFSVSHWSTEIENTLALDVVPKYLTSGTKLRIAELKLNTELVIKIWDSSDDDFKIVSTKAHLIEISQGVEKAKAIKVINTIPPEYIFKINTKNTKKPKCYVTWDGKELRPQTGPRLGLLGVTDSGLDKAGNVKKTEITGGKNEK